MDALHVPGLLVYVDEDLKRVNEDYTLTENTIIEFFEPPPKDSRLYVGANLLHIRDSKLLAIYEFTEEDESRTDPIIVTLSTKIDMYEDLILVSYVGRLDYEKHYIISEDLTTVIIYLRPKKDEIIEFFYYT